MVIDTCILIDFLRAKDKTKTELFKVSEIGNLCISAVTLYELYMGATSDSKMNDVKLLTEDLIVLPFDDEVSKKAAEIYHHLKSIHHLIEFRDIFIAATCIVNELPIKTLNVKHFCNIKDLKIFKN